MAEFKEFVDYMIGEIPGDYESMPDIDLYMDQILAYLVRKRVSSREGDGLTSAMVNNYIKDGLVPRANGKKYSREHLAYLTIIARLKQVLSVKDMTTLLRSNLSSELPELRYEHFRRQLKASFEGISDAVDEAELPRTVLELALSSYSSKIACEYLIDIMREREHTAADNPAAAKAEKPKTEKAKTEKAKTEKTKIEKVKVEKGKPETAKGE